MEETLTVVAPNVTLIFMAIAALGAPVVAWVVVKIRSLGGDKYKVTVRRQR